MTKRSERRKKRRQPPTVLLNKGSLQEQYRALSRVSLAKVLMQLSKSKWKRPKRTWQQRARRIKPSLKKQSREEDLEKCSLRQVLLIMPMLATLLTLRRQRRWLNSCRSMVRSLKDTSLKRHLIFMRINSSLSKWREISKSELFDQ